MRFLLFWTVYTIDSCYNYEERDWFRLWSNNKHALMMSFPCHIFNNRLPMETELFTEQSIIISCMSLFLFNSWNLHSRFNCIRWNLLSVAFFHFIWMFFSTLSKLNTKLSRKNRIHCWMNKKSNAKMFLNAISNCKCFEWLSMRKYYSKELCRKATPFIW